MLGGTFIYTGLAKLLALGGTVGYAASEGTPAPVLLVPLSMGLLIVAGISLVTGLLPRLGILASVLFLIPVTVIMHNFWALQGMERIIEFHSFKGNLCLLGASLMFLAIPEPWPLSLETWRTSHGYTAARFRR